LSLDFGAQFSKHGRFLTAVGLLFCLILVVAYFFYSIQPSFAGGGEVTEFSIDQGERFRDIGARLSRAGLVRSITMFKVYSFLSGSAQRLQPGVYELSSGMSVPEIVRILTTGGGNEIAVTVPEGVTLKDIDALLAVAGVTPEGALTSYDFSELVDTYSFLGGVSTLEGFLFPETYRFERGSSVREVVRRFLNVFEEKAWVLLEDEDEWEERLILASMLEREVPLFTDRQVVAGILLKRYAIGMLLQVDATVTYAKCNGTFLSCSNTAFARSDVRISSPYNTYQRLGLTPTPISNPGEAAIEAALTPTESPYFYYLSARETGETVFSRTLDEHNTFRAKYL
jgi:UPF0755 protein